MKKIVVSTQHEQLYAVVQRRQDGFYSPGVCVVRPLEESPRNCSGADVQASISSLIMNTNVDTMCI